MRERRCDEDKHLILNNLSAKSILPPHVGRGGYSLSILSCSGGEIRSGSYRAVVPAGEAPVYTLSSVAAISGAPVD
ncbi:MAG: hypothetical protein LBF05_02695, partial [Tannerella sp.]|nr:hypothetical protein [Tannerella sp.]